MTAGCIHWIPDHSYPKLCFFFCFMRLMNSLSHGTLRHLSWNLLTEVKVCAWNYFPPNLIYVQKKFWKVKKHFQGPLPVSVIFNKLFLSQYRNFAEKCSQDFFFFLKNKENIFIKTQSFGNLVFSLFYIKQSQLE